jgi:proteasome lid subunit RPN8/RPN11
MFGQAIDAQIMEYARSKPEIEIVGYISASREFVALDNISAEPEKSFVVQHGAFPDDALALVHSHNGGPFYPSEADGQQQIAMGVPWGIAAFDDNYSDVFWFGDETPKAPLVGRGFRHYVTDCYSLIRDFYHEIHDIELPEFPREWQWWEGDKPLYLDGFESAGFHEVSTKEILPGDVFLATVGRTKSANHAGVYLGNGLILHHSAGRVGFDPFRLSTVEGGARWLNLITKVLRHENDSLDRSVGQKIRY